MSSQDVDHEEPKERRLSNYVDEFDLKNSLLYMLPNEILRKVLNYLDVPSAKSAMLTCKKFYNVITTPKEFMKKLMLNLVYQDADLSYSPLTDLDCCMALLESNRKYESVLVANITRNNEIIHVLVMLKKFSGSIKQIWVHNCESLDIEEFAKLFRLLPNLENIVIGDVKLSIFNGNFNPPPFLKLQNLKILNSSEQIFQIFAESQIVELETDLKCQDFLKTQRVLKKLIMELCDLDLFEEEVQDDFQFQLEFLIYIGDSINPENFKKFLRSQVNLVHLDFQLDISGDEQLAILRTLPPSVKMLGFTPCRIPYSEEIVPEEIFKYRNNHVESLNITFIWVLCGENKWTLDMIERFADRFSALNFLSLSLNNCLENLMDLTFSKMTRLKAVEIELWNSESILPYLKIPKLKAIRSVNTKKSLRKWKMLFDANPSIEVIRIDNCNPNFFRLLLNECKNLKKILLDGYITSSERLILQEEFPQRYKMIEYRTEN